MNCCPACFSNVGDFVTFEPSYPSFICWYPCSALHHWAYMHSQMQPRWQKQAAWGVHLIQTNPHLLCGSRQQEMFSPWKLTNLTSFSVWHERASLIHTRPRYRPASTVRMCFPIRNHQCPALLRDTVIAIPTRQMRAEDQLLSSKRSQHPMDIGTLKFSLSATGMLHYT